MKQLSCITYSRFPFCFYLSLFCCREWYSPEDFFSYQSCQYFPRKM